MAAGIDILIGGSGEQLTLRPLARVGDACNIFGDPDTVKRKLDVPRHDCEAGGRNFEDIERTNLTSLLLARDEVALKAKRELLASEVMPHFKRATLVEQQVCTGYGALRRTIGKYRLP